MSHAHTWPSESLRVHCSARVARDELILKTEESIGVRRGQGWEKVRRYYTAVCPHLKCYSNGNELSKTIQCQLGHGVDYVCSDCNTLKQCRFCPTEFIVGTRDSGWPSKGTTVCITAWKNFGMCTTPFDIKWRSQIGSVYDCKTPFSFTPGSIQGAFKFPQAEAETSVRGISWGQCSWNPIHDARRWMGFTSRGRAVMFPADAAMEGRS